MSQYFGSIPESIGELSKLQVLVLDWNALSKSIPSSFVNLTELSVFVVEFNSLTGNIYPLKGLPIDSLFLQQNFLTGSIPKFTNPFIQDILSYFNLGKNQFTGYIPLFPAYYDEEKMLESPDTSLYSSYNWKTLNVYVIETNYFQGNLPNSTAEQEINMHGMTYFLVESNHLTGIIPSKLLVNCSFLYYLGLSGNHFHGSIPEYLVTDYPILNQFILSNNHFTSTIPEKIIYLNNLAVLDISNNQLHGTIPSNLISSLQFILTELFLQDNSFTGKLEKFLYWNLTTDERHRDHSHDIIPSNNQTHNRLKLKPILVDIDISNNQFSGSLPPSFFINATAVISFAATSNCLSGSLPTEICYMTNLHSLSLDGLSTADNCREYLFPLFSNQFNAFYVDHFIEGNIPDCFYELPNIESLHLSGNGLGGIIPFNLNLSTSLNDLSLSHNLLTGTIPDLIQVWPWLNLDLSYNRLTGTLDNDFNTFPADGFLSLEVNRLSGSIPSQIIHIANISILDGNLFSCDVNGNNLPRNDTNYKTYTCGSDNVNLVLIGWIISFLCFPILFYSMFLMLMKWFFPNRKDLNLNNNDNEDEDKEDVEVSMKSDLSSSLSSRSPQEDKKTKEGEEECKTTSRFSLGKHLQFSSTILLVQYFYRNLLTWKQAYTETHPSKVNILRLSVYFQEIRRAIFQITCFCIIILLPIYSFLSMNYSSYSIKYAWTISALLLSGEIAGIIVFFMLFIFIIWISYRMRYIIQRMDAKYPKYRKSHAYTKESIQMKRAKARSSIISKDPKEIVFIYCLISLSNLIIMGFADFSYVYIVLNYDTVVVNIAAFALASFRIYTNNVLLWSSLPYGTQLLTFLKKETFTFQRKSEFFYLKYTSRDVSFLENLTLFNNIVIPILAIFFILPDCFYNALFASASVTSSYAYENCFQYIYDDIYTHHCRTQTQELSYSPPFLYSYQCSSKIVINYVTVYILLFILVGVIIPVMTLFLKLVYDFLEADEILQEKLDREGVVERQPMNVLLSAAAGGGGGVPMVRESSTSSVSSSSLSGMNPILSTTSSLTTDTQNNLMELSQQSTIITTPSMKIQQEKKRLAAASSSWQRRWKKKFRIYIENILPQTLRSFRSLENSPSNNQNNCPSTPMTNENEDEAEVPVVDDIDENNSQANSNSTNNPNNNGTTPTSNNTVSSRSTLFATKAFSSIRGTITKFTKILPQVLFNKIRLTVQINSYFAILISFGALFPPLALIAGIAILSITYFEEYNIGHFLVSIRSYGYTWYENQIEKECEDIEQSIKLTLWSTLFVSSCFYGYILFDIVGDGSGWELAMPFTLLLAALPVGLWMGSNCYSYWYVKRMQFRFQRGDSTESAGRSWWSWWCSWGSKESVKSQQAQRMPSTTRSTSLASTREDQYSVSMEMTPSVVLSLNEVKAMRSQSIQQDSLKVSSLTTTRLVEEGDKIEENGEMSTTEKNKKKKKKGAVNFDLSPSSLVNDTNCSSEEVVMAPFREIPSKQEP
jgi:hypothetical protein